MDNTPLPSAVVITSIRESDGALLRLWLLTWLRRAQGDPTFSA